MDQGGMEVDLKEVWENIPPFGFVQWFVVAVGSFFLLVWTAIIGIVILQICGRWAWRLLQAERACSIWFDRSQ